MKPHPRGDAPTITDFHSLEEGMLNDCPHCRAMFPNPDKAKRLFPLALDERCHE